MKKIFYIMTFGLMLFASTHINGQSATLMPLVAADTVDATSGLDTVSKVIKSTAGYSAMGIQVVGTKISGTVSCKAYLYGSLDGTNYILTDSSAAFADQTTNTTYFAKVTAPFTHYKVQVRPATAVATTQKVRVRVYYILRKHD
jgi:hypothetical protein